MTLVIQGGDSTRVVVQPSNQRVANQGQGQQAIPQVMGIQGPPGVGIQLLGAYATLSDLAAAHPSGNAGDSYAVAGDLYTWDAGTNAWVNAGTFQGPTGTPGQIRYTGHGAPGTIVGSSPNDTYLDLDTGTVYKLL